MFLDFIQRHLQLQWNAIYLNIRGLGAFLGGPRRGSLAAVEGLEPTTFFSLAQYFSHLDMAAL